MAVGLETSVIAAVVVGGVALRGGSGTVAGVALGTIGLLGSKPSSDMMAECDTLLMIGSGFPWAEFLPEEGQARGVQIDIAPEMLSLRYPMEVPLQGESAETLRALLPLLEQKPEGGAWRKGIEEGVAASSRQDAQAKGLGEWLRARVVDVPVSLLPGEQP